MVGWLQSLGGRLYLADLRLSQSSNQLRLDLTGTELGKSYTFLNEFKKLLILNLEFSNKVEPALHAVGFLLKKNCIIEILPSLHFLETNWS